MHQAHTPIVAVALGFGLCFLWGMATGEIKNREDKWFLSGAFMCLVGLGMTLLW